MFKTLLDISYQVKEKSNIFNMIAESPTETQEAASFAYKLGYFVGSYFWYILIILLIILGIVITSYFVKKKKQKENNVKE